MRAAAARIAASGALPLASPGPNDNGSLRPARRARDVAVVMKHLRT